MILEDLHENLQVFFYIMHLTELVEPPYWNFMSLISLNKSPNYKHIYESLENLKGLHKDHLVTIRKAGSQFDMAIATFKKVNKEFILLLEDPNAYRVELGDISDVQIITSKFELYIDKVFINRISGSSISGRVSKFETKGFDKRVPMYYRLFIPLEKSINFHYYIAHIGYRTRKHISASCLRASYDQLSIDLYSFDEKETNTHYLILEASEKLTFEQFLDYCFSTLVSYGYVTGEFPQDQGYFFSYEKADLKVPVSINYSTLRPSIKSMYSPLYANAFGYMKGKSNLAQAEKVHRTLRVLTAREFSRICQWAYDSIEFSSILLLVIEASSSSLLQMPAGLSVALEGLTDLLVKGNEEKVAPIQDKKLAKQIRTELSKVIEANSDRLSEDGMKIIKARIDNINQLTNQAKLIKPFELLKFKLSDEDKKSIDHRNDFLHGRITLSLGDDIQNANNEIYYVALRLYTLLAVLILKSVGYDNKIVNYPIIYNELFNKKINEPFFRQV